MDTSSLPPHAPCRLQPARASRGDCTPCFASTRSVQIATWTIAVGFTLAPLCLHTLRADCNTSCSPPCSYRMRLCLHTLRADCNATFATCDPKNYKLCLHTLRADCNSKSTNSIFTIAPLCLHTLRADCNGSVLPEKRRAASPLPPHAPCRLQLPPLPMHKQQLIFASTRSVQIATKSRQREHPRWVILCLHTLRVDCNCPAEAVGQS